MEQVYGKRVLESIPHSSAHFAQYFIWAGGELLTTDPPRPNIQQDFEITRLEDHGSTVTFTLFDDHWDEIEEKLSKLYSNIQIQYGYLGNLSKTYNMLLTNYSISFNSSGVILTVSAITQGSHKNAQPVSITTGTNNPTEAVKAICREMKWTVIDENFDASENFTLASEETFNVNEDNPITYISNVLVPAASKDNETYYFYLDDNNVAYFKKIDYNNTGEASRTYVYQKGYDSVVLDMTFDIKGVFGGTNNFVVTGAVAEVIDPLTKEISQVSATLDSTRTTVTGAYSHTNSSQSIIQSDSYGMNKEQVSAMLNYRMKNASDSIYEATMNIVGDPSVELLDTIRIINITDYGNLHHTSGLYLVIGITDTISGGTMTTTLKLIRNGDISSGIELMNYRRLIK